MLVDDFVYIDTRPNTGGLFSSSASVKDYTQWLRDRCKNSHRMDSGKQVFYGIGQRVNQLAYHSKKQITAKDKAQPFEVLCFGPHAGAAAQVLQELGVHESHVKVLA